MRYALALIIVLGALYMAKQHTVRGVRNNNPLNIRIGNNWQGEAAIPRDKAFETFKHHKYGFRAGAKLLRNYQRLYHLYSLEQIIHRFAPPNENDTKNYAGFVAKRLGVSVHDHIDLFDDETLAKVMHAMSIMEVGRYYSLDDARQGVALA
ncbi:structural protein [Vibrio sp. SCSIO 43132]|uniref:structural protein n=1 Tax=Vibrio sp. SCSIO 43132 TaxID=2779363 RepID=UPI001CA9D36D|nr:structural protein [Vibrio sp. SCSIO 43132]UAB72394.1 structural protein [Vibrio sp. SCSIO 43132]